MAVVVVVLLPGDTTESGDTTDFGSGLPPVVNMASHLCKSSFARRSKSSSSLEDEEEREEEMEAVEAEEMEMAEIEEEELTCSLLLLLSGMLVCRLRSAATASNPLPLAVASLLSVTTEVVLLATIACLFLC